MRKIILIYLLLVIVACVSCSRQMSWYDKEICQAEQLIQADTDSALAILGTIDPADLKVDSLKAKYCYLKAYGHMISNHSMDGDSLISFAHNYYKGKNIVNDIRCGSAYAWYKFWIGDTPGAIAMLDSLTSLTNVPDSLMVQILRTRVLLGATEYQGFPIIPLSKRLLKLERDTLRKMEAKYMLMSGYEYAGDIDSALFLVNELIDYARIHRWGDKQFLFMVEKAQLLTESGQVDESDRLVSEIFSKAGADNGAADMLHFQYAVNALNRGDVVWAAYQLKIADSLAVKLRSDDDVNFRIYSNLIHTMIDFKQTGRVKLMHITGQNNRQGERLDRMKASRWELERDALHQQNLALTLKAESEHKTVIILIISLAALLILASSVYIFIMRRQRERDSEERIEALQKMVDEYNSLPAQKSENIDTREVRRVMLKQLGIIKMVAETPTEQNREMLRKISSIDGDTNGELVNWKMVFEMIDNIYSGFYSKLHQQYGNLLNPKEEQIIVLMLAGFSTKEISVITGQTTSTIYVRKSSIRKKLGVPEKEDIVEFLKSKSVN